LKGVRTHNRGEGLRALQGPRKKNRGKELSGSVPDGLRRKQRFILHLEAKGKKGLKGKDVEAKGNHGDVGERHAGCTERHTDSKGEVEKTGRKTSSRFQGGEAGKIQPGPNDELNMREGAGEMRKRLGGAEEKR